MAVGGFYGGAFYSSIGNVFLQWEQSGVFDYVIPGLLIFSVIYGILSTIKIFGKNKGVDVIVALCIAFLAVLRFEFVPMFFREIFPRMGVALAVLLTFIILMGLFVDWTQRSWGTIFAIIGAGLALIVIAGAFSSPFYQAGWWQQYGSAIIVLVIIGVVVTVVVLASRKKDQSNKTMTLPLKGLWGDDD